MRSSRISGPGRNTGRKNSEIPCQISSPPMTASSIWTDRFPMRIARMARPLRLAFDRQCVFLFRRHRIEDAITLGELEELPLGIDDLGIPFRQEDQTVGEPFLVCGDRCRILDARQLAMRL